MRRAVLLLLTLVLALGACSDDTSEADPPEPTSSEPTSTPDTPPSYVALGDSYTAAPLITEETADDGCLRSSTNYPQLVAADLGYDLTDVSCSGATSENLISPQATSTGQVPAQLDAVTADTDLVTLSIGGNDDGVFTRLVGCATTGDPTCGDLATAIDGLGDHLTQAVEAIRTAAPDARLVVVGYPAILGDGETCDALPVAAKDVAKLAALNERLSTVQRRAARAAGTTYVDLYAASADHGVCSDDPWVNGIQTTPGVGLALHPLAAGQRATADLVLDALS